MKINASTALLLLPLGALTLAGCGGSDSQAADARPAARSGSGGSLGGDAGRIAEARGLTPDDVTAALKTYMPTGRHDDHIMFSSGGHGGQVLMIGLPSMRLLRVIGVFTPEPWQGWGYGIGNDVLEQGTKFGREVPWADTHHPAISETNGEYDGQFLFINDKANARIAVIDLRDFETKQIVANPVAVIDHGGAFVTPNTEYICEGGQFGTPLAGYAPIEKYNESYRGLITFWKFDRQKGRIDMEKSFALELPPYWQDLVDAGKKVSEGWVFCNSFNTELATGTGKIGDKNFFEAGISQHDMDYLHIINLRKAEELHGAGKVERIKGFPVISLKTAVAEGILHFAPEPKSPHGVDVTPGGEFLVIAGKLDPHITVFSFERIRDAIAQKAWTSTDPYGVPVLDFDSVVEAQVEVGLGPLHTQFDDKGYAYTSLFLVPGVARWTLGGPYAGLHPESPWQLVQQINVHYNIGHLSAVQGDTVSPGGKYLVALNKWSIDRFYPTGPLLPQNLQLIDIDNTGANMRLLYDMPVGIGEPHSAQIIPASKLSPWEVYPEVGWDPVNQRVDLGAPMPGKERVERKGSTTEIWMTTVRSHFVPERVSVKQGDQVIWHVTNVETAKDATHGLALPVYNINVSLEPGETGTFEFTADTAGVFPYYCSEFCSALHMEMAGYVLVEPSARAEIHQE